jgi:hypothetical protein
MGLPAWPIPSAIILQNGFKLQRMLDPISTDMPPSTRINIANVNRELMPQIRAALGVRQYIQVQFSSLLP